jgi:SAM-dependent methyltransferase
MICIETDKPVAYDSPDHLEPWGTARDNSVNWRFNRKLFAYLSTGVRVLDLGCAGGGFVKSILDAGGFAVGVEGSDYSKKHRRAEWATIPDHLFTADVTVPFRLESRDERGVGKPLLFDVITAWELLEHIAEDGLAGMAANILAHLDRGGIVIASIAPYEDVVNGVRLHQTVRELSWWIERLGQLGLERRPAIERYFHLDWVRGGLGKPSFTVALARAGDPLPSPGRLRLLTALYTPYEGLRLVKRLMEMRAQRHNEGAGPTA